MENEIALENGKYYIVQDKCNTLKKILVVDITEKSIFWNDRDSSHFEGKRELLIDFNDKYLVIEAVELPNLKEFVPYFGKYRK